MSITFPRNPYHGQGFKSADTDCNYYYDNNRKSWIFQKSNMGGDGPGATVFVQIDPPLPEESFIGTLWVQLPTYYLYVYHDNAWVGLTNNAENDQMIFSGDTPPQNADQNSLWYDTENSDLRILYKDEDSTQWVTVSSSDMSQVIISQSIDSLEAQVSSLTMRVDNIEDIPRLVIE